MRSTQRLYLSRLLTLLACTLITLTSIFIDVNDYVYCKLMNISALPQKGGDILIIEIDQESINKYGTWPWDRSLLAKMINNVQELEPKVIGIPITFSEKSIDKYDKKLIDALVGSNSVLGYLELQSIYPFFKYSNVGFLELEYRLGAVVGVRDNIDSFPFKVSLLNNDISKRIFKDDNSTYYSMYYYKSSFSRISAKDILKNNQFDNPNLKGKIVLIGVTLPFFNEITPFGSISRVEVYANIIQSIVDGKRIQFNSVLNVAVAFLIFILGSILLFRSKISLFAILFVVSLIVVILFSYYFQVILNILGILVAIILVFFKKAYKDDYFIRCDRV